MLSLIAKLKKQKEAEEEKHRQNQETAKIYAQYVKSFDGKEGSQPLKFVKSDVYDPSTGTTSSTVNEVFSLGIKTDDKPEQDNDELSAKYLSQIEAPPPLHINQTKSSKVREIDTFIEEIKEKQRVINERKELHKKILTATTEFERHELSQKISQIDNDPNLNLLDYNSTNVYVGNLSPNITENVLMAYFSKYGHVQGIRIMPSRTDQNNRSVTSAFVSYNTHEEAEKAKDCMDGVELLSIPCKTSWAKNLMKPALHQQVSPLAPNKDFTPQILYNVPLQPPTPFEPIFQIYFPIPNHKKKVIDLISKYVSEAGEEFEQVIMEKERPDGLFSFMFETNTPESVYYRWRVYSLLQGDSLTKWKTDSFKITEFGKFYNPPLCEFNLENNSTTKNKYTNSSQTGYVPLTHEQQSEFDSLISNLSTTRNDVCNLMLFTINNSESAYYLTDQLINLFLDESTQVFKKIAILYVLSDVLYNSSCSKQCAWIYRNSIEKRIPEIFDSIKKFKAKSTSKIASQQLIDAVMNLLSIWEGWTVYSSVFLKGLEATLFGDDIISYNTLPGRINLHDMNVNTEFEEYKPLLSSNDGSDMDYFEILSKLPLKYREEAYKYLMMRMKELRSLCSQRGLMLNPSDRLSLVARMVMYDKYHYEKQVAEEKRLEVMKNEGELSQGSDMDESDMEQDDDMDVIEQSKIKEATVQLQKTLMKRTFSPEKKLEPEEVKEADQEPPEPLEPESEPQPVIETQQEDLEDDIDDIFAS